MNFINEKILRLLSLYFIKYVKMQVYTKGTVIPKGQNW